MEFDMGPVPRRIDQTKVRTRFRAVPVGIVVTKSSYQPKLGQGLPVFLGENPPKGIIRKPSGGGNRRGAQILYFSFPLQVFLFKIRPYAQLMVFEEGPGEIQGTAVNIGPIGIMFLLGEKVPK